MKISSILIVDDEPLVLRVTQMALKRTTDWRISTANSGHEAIAYLSRALPDVLLLDAMMPVLDGLETLVLVRAIPGAASLPVIIYTAYPARAQTEEFRALGLLGVISKPFDAMQLAAQIERMATRC